MKLLKLLIRFFVFFFFISIITMPLAVFYGPFTNVKRAAVESIVTSMHPQVAKWFMSEKEIEELIGFKPGLELVEAAGIKSSVIHFTNSHDKNIELEPVTGKYYSGYLLMIHDPTRVRVALAGTLPRRGETTSHIAQENNALAAVNAGGFSDHNGTGTGGIPDGIIIENGSLLYNNVEVGQKTPTIGMNSEGSLVVGYYTVDQIRKMKLKEAVTFGPPLIVDGRPMITRGDGGWGYAPRTAIGQRLDGTILFLVIDGRQPPRSIGATLRDVQDILQQHGAYNAANLDGGSSATMYYKDEVVNHPSDLLGERYVPSVFIVK